MQADIVKAITFVDGTGNITRVNRNNRVGRGLAGGLGMLGVMTEITLQLQPGLGKTRSWGTGARSDTNMAQEVLDLWVRDCYLSQT
jgi:FAD/FMN-containing dehydrogenase